MITKRKGQTELLIALAITILILGTIFVAQFAGSIGTSQAYVPTNEVASKNAQCIAGGAIYNITERIDGSFNATTGVNCYPPIVLPLLAFSPHSCTISSATGVMAGFKLNYTTAQWSQSEHSILILLFFQINSPATSGLNTQYQLAFGTGNAPSCGASTTGTSIGNTFRFSTVSAVTGNNPQQVIGVAKLLTPSTTYWFDLKVLDSSTVSWSYGNSELAIIEK